MGIFKLSPIFLTKKISNKMFILNLKRVENILFYIEEKGCIFLGFTLFILSIIMVISRYLFSSPITGGDELANWLFVWFSFFGISNLVGKNEHASVDFFLNSLSSKSRFYIQIINKIVILCILFIILYKGMPFAIRMMTIYWGNLPIPKGCATFAIPTTVFFMIVHILISIVFLFKERGKYLKNK